MRTIAYTTENPLATCITQAVIRVVNADTPFMGMSGIYSMTPCRQYVTTS